jgi:CheY-like chemotaxis protein
MSENGKLLDQGKSRTETPDLEKGQRAEIKTQGIVENPKRASSPGESIPCGKDENAAPKSSERKFRILVVDDSQNIREMIEDFLDFEGHQPALAKDGEEALKLFSEQEFDLVITDLGMPGMSGWKLSKHIKQRKPETPIIIITGWGAQLSDEDLRRNEVELLLSKPFHLDQVKEAIDTVAGKLSRQPKAGKRSD